jgi:hypothetical protein
MLDCFPRGKSFSAWRWMRFDFMAQSVQVMRQLNSLIAHLMPLLPEKRHAALRGRQARA